MPTALKTLSFALIFATVLPRIVSAETIYFLVAEPLGRVLHNDYVYTWEGKESLASTNWLALPGAAWPLKTNHWALPLANAPARFYRVRAESPILNANFTRQRVAPDPRIQARLFWDWSKD